MKKIYLFLFIVSFFLPRVTYSATYYSRVASGSWTTGSTWSTVSCNGTAAGSTPTAADDVVICSGHTITMTGSPGNCFSLTLNGTINWATAITTNVGTGGIAINSGGNIMGSTATGILYTTGNLTVNNGAFCSVDRTTLSINGQTYIDGSITFSNNIGVKTFQGLVTINGSWTSTAITTANNLNFQSGITYNGATFSAGGAVFSTNPQSINGSSSLNFSNNVTVTGITVTNNTIVSMTNTGSGALSGTGKWTQGTGSTLNYTGMTMTITNFDATASYNTVIYDATGVQTIKCPLSNSYYNLSVSNSGTKTLACATTILGNVAIGTGATLSGSTFSHVVQGNWTNNGTFNPSTGTVIFAGTSSQLISGSSPTSFYHLSLSNTSFATVCSTNVSVNGTLAIAAGATISPEPPVIISGTGTLTGSGTVNVTRTTATPDFNSQYTMTTKNLSALTVNYNGESDQIVNALTYNHLILSKTGVLGFDVNKTAAGNITVNGNLTIYAEADFDAGTFSHTFAGNWMNDGTFTAGTGTITFNGASSVIGTSPTSFNHLTINSGSSLTARAGNTDVAGNFTNNGTFNHNSGTVTLTGASAAAMLGSATFYDLAVSKTGNSTVTFSGNTNVQNNFYLSSGNALITGVNFYVNSNTAISGGLDFNNPAGVKSFNNIAINSGAAWSNSGNADVTITGNFESNGTFTPGTGTCTFSGTGLQTINGSSAITMHNLILNNSSSGGLILNAPLNLNGSLTLTDGMLNTTLGNILTLNNGASSTTGSANSFVNGPMQRTGITSFVFPVGDINNSARWRPIGIGTSSSVNTFRAGYKEQVPSNRSTLDGTLKTVSSIELWRLEKVAGTGNVSVTLYWEQADESGIDDCANLRIAYWDGSQWASAFEGNSTTSGLCTGSNAGSIAASVNAASYGTFTFGSASISLNPFNYKFFWVANAGNWSDFGSHWSKSSNGSPNRPFKPRGYDDVYFDASSFSGPGQLLTVDVNCCMKSINFLSPPNSPVMIGTGSVSVGSNNTPGTAGAISGVSAVCEGETGVAFSVTAVANTNSYIWKYTGTGFTVSSGSNTNSITADFSAGATSGELFVIPVNNCGEGGASPVFSITVSKIIISDAGADQSVCGTIATLAGNNPAPGTGLWTLISGAGTITDPTSPTSGVTALGTGDNTFRWTISNGGCSPSMDDVIITTNQAATASANVDATICEGSTYSLSGSRGGSASSSNWTSSGTGFFDDATLLGATYTPSAADILGGIVTLTITTNDPVGPCPSASDAMVLTINTAATASANVDATICSGSNYTLSGSRGGSATSSMWTTSGTGFFDDATLLGATYTPSAADITAGTVTLTIMTNNPAGPCPAVSDAMVLTINALPTAANAGIDIYPPACDLTNPTLAGNTPVVGTGLWSVVSGTASITAPGSPTSEVTGLAVPGTATLRWTISNSPCAASTDDVVITTTACFTCGSPFTDVRDGKSYNTVLIGSQCWMAENLNIGISVTGVTEQTNNATIEKYCFADNASNCTTYGGLYQWAEMVQYTNGATNTTSPTPTLPANLQGICPSGWHLPTDAEWCTMENTVEAGTDAGCNVSGWRGTNTGAKLKTTSGWTINNGTNTSGFSALPGGYRTPVGSFLFLSDYGYWWPATENSAANGWYRYLYYMDTRVLRDAGNKASGFSCRCVKD